MRARTLQIRQFVAAALLFLPAVFLCHGGVHAQYATIDELAFGEATAYFVYWDPAALTLEERSSEPGVDYWRLSDGAGVAEILAHNAPGTTTADCVRDFLDAIAADSATVSLESLPFIGSGPPQILGDRFAELVRTTSGPNGREKTAGSVECQEIVPGQSLALIYVHMPARTYNERALRDVRIPGIDFAVYDDLIEHGVPKPILDDSGHIVGTLFASPPCRTGVVRILAHGGESGSEFSVDPESIVVVDLDGGDSSVATELWSLPEARREASLHLGSGDIGLLRVVVAVEEDHDVELYFTGPTGKLTRLTNSGNCGEGGAAPVPIDID